MVYLGNTKRCLLFETIARDTWHHIIKNHSVGQQVSEVGKTNDIIADIKHNRLSYPNIGIWAYNGFRENHNGSDMDLFVETRTGEFVWWALQAKVLKLNGKYEGLDVLHGGEHQWKKLNRLANNAGCKVRYLFYNGVASYNYTGIDNCKRTFEEEQFGCSLVKTEDVKRIALSKVPTFSDFHPEFAQPWRIITCCPHIQENKNGAHNEIERVTYYSSSQIREATYYYPEKYGNTEFFESDERTEQVNDLPLDAIDTFSKSIERKPDYRIVVRTTSSLFNR